MVTEVDMVDGLDELVAATILRPVIDRAADIAQSAAKRKAPPVKVWVTAHDEKVRPSHVKTDGQECPDNLRFKVPKTKGDGHDLATRPRDPDLPPGNRINCRCEAVELKTALADSINAEPIQVAGPRVSKTVYTDFPRAGEAEVGNTHDQGVRFFRGALNEAAARMREAVARGT